MSNVIRIKPHHFVDMLTVLGDESGRFGPHPYGHAFGSLGRRVTADPQAVLAIELGADDVCAPCVHNLAGRCDDTIDTSYRPAAPALKREWNLLVDRRWCERLGVKPGDRLVVRALAELVRERAGDITDIYREIPADRTAERARKLAAGLEVLLGPKTPPAGGPIE